MEYNSNSFDALKGILPKIKQYKVAPKAQISIALVIGKCSKTTEGFWGGFIDGKLESEDDKDDDEEKGIPAHNSGAKNAGVPAVFANEKSIFVSSPVD